MLPREYSGVLAPACNRPLAPWWRGEGEEVSGGMILVDGDGGEVSHLFLLIGGAERGGDRCRKLGLACYRHVLRLPKGDIVGTLSCSRTHRPVVWYRFTFLPEDGGISFFRNEFFF
jgi:hypothetical protein